MFVLKNKVIVQVERVHEKMEYTWKELMGKLNDNAIVITIKLHS